MTQDKKNLACTVRRDKTELELMAHIRGLNSINEKYAGIARLL